MQGGEIDKKSYVYILANRPHGTIYVGVTSNLCRRISQHKNNEIEGFTKQYRIHELVYFETFGEITKAIYREKQLKKWKREWKDVLIEKENQNWDDLYPMICLN